MRTSANNATARRLILAAALLSFALSVGLFFLGDDKADAIFVGIWVPSILGLGAFIAPAEQRSQR